MKVELVAQRTRPDLSCRVLTMSRKNNSATIADLNKVNKVLKKVSSKKSEMFYWMIEKKEELQIVEIGDA